MQCVSDVIVEINARMGCITLHPSHYTHINSIMVKPRFCWIVCGGSLQGFLHTFLTTFLYKGTFVFGTNFLSALTLTRSLLHCVMDRPLTKQSHTPPHPAKEDIRDLQIANRYDKRKRGIRSYHSRWLSCSSSWTVPPLYGAIESLVWSDCRCIGVVLVSTIPRIRQTPRTRNFAHYPSAIPLRNVRNHPAGLLLISASDSSKEHGRRHTASALPCAELLWSWYRSFATFQFNENLGALRICELQKPGKRSMISA